MRPTLWKLRLLGASTLLAALATGCETSPPGAGFTNSVPGETGASDKPAVRDDLPVPDTTDVDQPIAEAADAEANSTDAGIGVPPRTTPGKDSASP